MTDDSINTGERPFALRLVAWGNARHQNILLAAALLTLHAQRMSLAARQRHLADRFTAAHPGVPVSSVPALAEDVHDLAGLRMIGDLLADSL